ncbi:MAG: PadR family transcriptional regulator [Nitrosopumilaceae archaeon]|nr:PadR family transcriptional regulator [Nitrosopumilaceae archaeon]
MINEWLKRVGSSVPRGFSRYFILDLLKNRTCTGKEIINIAIEQSNGIWRPSPGLIYPLLKRLQEEELIEEKDNKYKITIKGKSTTEDLDTINDIVKKQLDVLFRVGNVGRFIAMDILERVKIMGTMLSSNVSNLTKDEATRYKEFLQGELEKINNTKNGDWKNIPIE